MPNSKPFFSLILPNYKTEPFLEECLQSIKTQTFEDFECLLLNDGSPGLEIFEKTKKTSTSSDFWFRQDFVNQILPRDQKTQAKTIFEKTVASDLRFKYFEHSNMGQGPTRNKGLELAIGQRVVFVDCDDFLDKDYLQKVYNQLQKTPKAICFADIQTYKDGKVASFNSFQKHVPLENNLKTLLVYPTWSINTVNYFWELEFIKRNKIEYLGGKGEDTKFLINCLLAFYKENSDKVKFQKIENSGYFYRLFEFQNFRELDFEQKLFVELTKFVEEKLPNFKPLGWRYYFLAKLFIYRFRLYNFRSQTQNFLSKNLANLVVKILTLGSYFLADYKKN